MDASDFRCTNQKSMGSSHSFDLLRPKREYGDRAKTTRRLQLKNRQGTLLNIDIMERSRFSILPKGRKHIRVNSKDTIHISLEHVLAYLGFNKYFGPLSLDAIFNFHSSIERVLIENPSKNIILTCNQEECFLTNAVFLIGSYLIVKFPVNPDEVIQKFLPANDFLVSFRDVSSGEQNFHLYLRDCWAGLWKAKQLGWLNPNFENFDASEYSHYSNPMNADLHEIVPGKFIAMRSPKNIANGQLWCDVWTDDGRFCRRDLSPALFVDILRDFDVQAVVRLNAPAYRKEAFTDAGLGFVDLYFEDCTCPPVEVVAKFMAIAEGLPGALAVHCKSGLGGTGTLIALYMMQHYDFTAREAMGWLRIVRPGSVIGPQQQYLVEREAVMRRTGAQYRRHGPNVTLRPGDPAAVSALIADAVSVVDTRLQALRNGALQRRPAGRSPPLRSAGEPGGLRRAMTALLAAGGDGPASLRGSAAARRSRCGGGGRAAEGGPGAPGEPSRYCADLLPLPTARALSGSPRANV